MLSHVQTDERCRLTPKSVDQMVIFFAVHTSESCVSVHLSVGIINVSVKYDCIKSSCIVC